MVTAPLFEHSPNSTIAQDLAPQSDRPDRASPLGSAAILGDALLRQSPARWRRVGIGIAVALTEQRDLGFVDTHTVRFGPHRGHRTLSMADAWVNDW